MESLFDIAVTNLEIQEGDLVLLGIIAAALSVVGAYVRKLHQELRRAHKLLENQMILNRKLDSTLSRLLKIDEAGGIDSNHPYRR
jgi:hypothetical protein